MLCLYRNPTRSHCSVVNRNLCFNEADESDQSLRPSLGCGTHVLCGTRPIAFDLLAVSYTHLDVYKRQHTHTHTHFSFNTNSFIRLTFSLKKWFIRKLLKITGVVYHLFYFTYCISVKTLLWNFYCNFKCKPNPKRVTTDVCMSAISFTFQIASVTDTWRCLILSLIHI